MPFSALFVRSSILYVIRCLTGGQCSLRRTGVICSELRVLVTSRAAQFSTLTFVNMVGIFSLAITFGLSELGIGNPFMIG